MLATHNHTQTVTLFVESLADELEIPASEVIDAAIAAGARDFQIDDEPFDDEQIASEWDELTDDEQERVTFALEDEQIERFAWLTCYTS